MVQSTMVLLELLGLLGLLDCGYLSAAGGVPFSLSSLALWAPPLACRRLAASASFSQRRRVAASLSPRSAAA